MILTVDMGNTSIKIGLFLNEKIIFFTRLATVIGKTSFQYASEIMQMLDLNGIDAKGISRAVLSSVVPELTEEISNAIAIICSCRPVIITGSLDTGIDIKIDNPAQLGSDLLVSAVGAANKYTLPCFIVDFGTATKISAVNENREFIGCMIAPGIELNLKSLAGSASLLHSIPLQAPEKCIGTNTVEAMQSGIILGTASMIDGMIDKFTKELGRVATVIFTGGNCKKIMSHCKCSAVYDEYLLLDGLKAALEKIGG